VYNETDYATLLDHYEILIRSLPGLTFSDIKDLSMRERLNWIDRALRQVNDG
jgi:hypothetical protein